MPLPTGCLRNALTADTTFTEPTQRSRLAFQSSPQIWTKRCPMGMSGSRYHVLQGPKTPGCEAHRSHPVATKRHAGAGDRTQHDTPNLPVKLNTMRQSCSPGRKTSMPMSKRSLCRCRFQFNTRHNWNQCNIKSARIHAPCLAHRAS